jgi:hypothetical protein
MPMRSMTHTSRASWARGRLMATAGDSPVGWAPGAYTLCLQYNKVMAIPKMTTIQSANTHDSQSDTSYEHRSRTYHIRKPLTIPQRHGISKERGEGASPPLCAPSCVLSFKSPTCWNILSTRQSNLCPQGTPKRKPPTTLSPEEHALMTCRQGSSFRGHSLNLEGLTFPRLP